MTYMSSKSSSGLFTKVEELCDRQATEKADVFPIQETKFAEKDATLPFPSFNSIQVDRPTTHNRGGLFTMLKKGTLFQLATEGYNPPLERIIIKFKPLRRRWATIHKEPPRLITSHPTLTPVLVHSR